ncbi:Toprim-like [Algoriphagus locisalis]|uniref:Toprim-like n=1 Tax=Algoriphagus locisalis TaxID=305507 RepID=A0A1I6YM82_9BACT|nr:toprim domain-containing protein [Algoriphagus locisalis]SFT51507.1 Toprim-like [Algoriphagus locisalis]
MNCKQANQISILDYLSAIGTQPAKNLGSYSIYFSPFREEKTPSFKVDHKSNLWIDFGNDNEGGTLVDLVLKLNLSFSVEDALNHLTQMNLDSFSFQQQDNHKELKADSKIQVYAVKPIGTNNAISEYIECRGLTLFMARQFCKEVYFEVDGKKYFGVGNQNSNGWSIRNKYWKGCTAQGISIFGDPKGNGNSTLAIFEGIFDLMSYFQRNNFQEILSCLMSLNSLANTSEASSYFEHFKTVELYLDRDDQGKKKSKDLQKEHSHCMDRSADYIGYKDYNEMLMHEGRLGFLR